MDITVNKTALVNQLKSLSTVIEKKTTIPILNNVRLEAKDGKLFCEGTDLDLSSRGSLSADIATPGARCVEFNRFLKLIELSSVEEIRLAAMDSQLVVTAGRRKHNLPALDVASFPEQLAIKGVGLELDGKKLAAQVAHIAFAITNAESRYSLNGARIELHPDKVRLVATDGTRLSLVDYQIDLPIEQPQSDLVPAKALIALQKFADNSAKFKLSLAANALCAATETTALRTRMLSGNFPTYDLVLPKWKQTLVAEVDRQVWLNSLKAGMVTADNQAYSIKLAFGPDTLTTSSQSQDVGVTEDVISIKYNGPEFVVGFNGSLLEDFLNVATADVVALRFNADKPELNQMEMREADDVKALWRYVVMPMRL